MLINVTQAHIDTGAPCSPFRCPVVLAIKDATGAAIVVVRRGYIFIAQTGDIATDGGEYYDVPANAAAFIDAFDDGLNPAPISFELPITEAKQ